MAYASTESGQFEVYVRPFPNVEDGRWQISRDGGNEPLWGPDGGELFFRDDAAGSMMIVAAETEPIFNHGNPEVLFAASYRGGAADRARPFDLSPNGERFLMIKNTASGDDVATDAPIVVVLDWIEELRQLAPVD